MTGVQTCALPIYWLLLDNYLFNILSLNDFIIIDTEDYLRYQRLASNSTTALIKAFLLKLLKDSQFLIPFDYVSLYPPKHCKEVLSFANIYSKKLYNIDTNHDVLLYESL